jgi:hypothetical protein
MRQRKAEKDDQPVAERLVDVAVEAADDLIARVLVIDDDVPELFAIELLGNATGIDEITEQNGRMSLEDAGWSHG